MTVPADRPRPLDALSARVNAAADELSEPERRALALRERDGAGYADIATALGVEPAEIAGLLVSARLGVSAAVHRSVEADAGVDECAHARRLLAMRQDGELRDGGDRMWLDEHVAGCAGCQATRRALREASLACRAWRPEAMKPVALGAAADVVRGIQRQVETAPRPAEAPVVSVADAVVEQVSAAIDAPRPAPAPTPAARPPRRARRRRGFFGVLFVAFAVAALGAFALTRSDEPEREAPAAAPAAPSPEPGAAEDDDAAAKAAERRRARARARARARRRAAERRRAQQAAAAATPVPTAVSTPAPAATTAPEPTATSTPAPKPPASRPTPAPTPAPVSNGEDIVPPPGDEFCPEGDPGC